MKICVAQINPTIGDLAGNQHKILNAIEFAKKQKCDLVLTPELALIGYPPEDILLLSPFIKDTELSLKPLIEASKGIILVVGTIRPTNEGAEKPLYNSAAICYDGKLLGFQDKMLLPTYDVFDERRYFEPAQESKLWQIANHTLGVTICEDLWQHSGSLVYPYARDPVLILKEKKPACVVNLSASPYHVGKLPVRFEVCAKAARSLNCTLVLCNQVGGNDSLIFDGHSVCINSQGVMTQLAQGFEEELLIVDTEKTTAANYKEERLAELYQALVLGLHDYFEKSGFKKACLGISGGIDSALTACLAVKALGASHVLGVFMPSCFTSSESKEDAAALAKNLGIEMRTIPIEEPFTSFLNILQPHFEGKEPDVTEENLQARIRGIILMALSNKLGSIVLSTGNKSELAMGYSTLYGDMCGGLAVISDLTKEQVYALSHWINQSKAYIPERTLTRAPSAELRPNQKDTDSLPEYSIVDAVLTDYIEKGMSPKDIAKSHHLDVGTVNNLVCKIHANEYKRRQSPPGLRVTEKAFSIGRRFPIVQKWA